VNDEEVHARSTHAKPVVGRRRLDKLAWAEGRIADAPLVVMMLRPPSPLPRLSLRFGVALELIHDAPLPNDQSSDDLPELGGATISFGYSCECGFKSVSKKKRGEEFKF
jgi:hypothetical protein